MGDLSDEFGEFDENDLIAAEQTGEKRRLNGSNDVSVPASKRLKGASLDQTYSIPRDILFKTWGFAEFRLKQSQAISRLLTGKSAVVVFPTGGGKSLVYQVPALAFDEYDEECGRDRGGGVTLVVSPLIALMKDQVDALRRRGVLAAAMDSSQSRESWLDTCDKLRNGSLKLLYVAPERLNNEGFVQMISHTKIRLVAIDEAHCISEWGHAFRPDYLKIARFTKEIRAERVLCLTATATPKVADDICEAFDIDKQGVFRTSTFRSNLHLLAQSFAKTKDKESAIIGFFKKNKGSSIVYVQTHQQTEDIGRLLRGAGYNASEYHAGMTTEARTLTQERFMTSKTPIVVATIAFGMGIDKADIRNIVHYAMPKSIEGYSQEIGRAGRDGKVSKCMIYLCHEDFKIMEEWSRADVPSFRSVKGLVGESLEIYKHAKAGEIIERNINDESKDWDIRRNALDLLNAQLELRFELIRATTPKYSQYKYVTTPSFSSATSANDTVTSTLKRVSKPPKKGNKWAQIDVDAAAKVGGFPREDAVRRLQQWHDSNAVELQPSGVINRFRILKPFPKTEQEKSAIVSGIYNQIKARERSDMARVQSVITLVTSESCLARNLARHFGDEESVPAKGCGNCQYCTSGERVEYVEHGIKKAEIDEGLVRKLLKATNVRDDARFLARVGFGISSPRVTMEKLGRHEVFGSMAHVDFESLVKRFEKECKE